MNDLAATACPYLGRSGFHANPYRGRTKEPPQRVEGVDEPTVFEHRSVEVVDDLQCDARFATKGHTSRTLAKPRALVHGTREARVEPAAERCYTSTMDAESRKAARANWQVVVRRNAPAATEAADDCAFWLRIPVDERAAATWELSREVFALAELNGGVFDEETGLRMETGALDERRLPRTAFRVSRR